MSFKNQLQKELDVLVEKELYLKKILKLSEQYPDLKEHRHLGFGERELSTKEVNSIVTDAEFRSYSYSDEYYVAPYVLIDGIKIFSEPRQIKIGEDYSDGIGIVPYEEWKKELALYGISSALESIIEKHLKERLPEKIEE